MNIGKVVQVIGPVVDVAFDEKNLPSIYTAVRIVSESHMLPAISLNFTPLPIVLLPLP